MHAEQELQKIEEPPASQKSSEETQIKMVDTECEVITTVSTPLGLDTQTQTVSSTNIVPTPQVIESTVTPTDNLEWQRQQGQLDASRTAASLRSATSLMGTSVAPTQVAVTTTLAVVGGVVHEESDMMEDAEQVPVGSVVPNTERYVWPGHQDAQYIDVFPSEMSINQTDPALRLDPDEGWRLLYPFMGPGVRRLQVNTPVNLARMVLINKTLQELLVSISYLQYEADLLGQMQNRLNCIYSSMHGLRFDTEALYEFMRALASEQLNPMIIPPDIL